MAKPLIWREIGKAIKKGAKQLTELRRQSTIVNKVYTLCVEDYQAGKIGLLVGYMVKDFVEFGDTPTVPDFEGRGEVEEALLAMQKVTEDDPKVDVPELEEVEEKSGKVKKSCISCQSCQIFSVTAGNGRTFSILISITGGESSFDNTPKKEVRIYSVKSLYILTSSFKISYTCFSFAACLSAIKKSAYSRTSLGGLVISSRRSRTIDCVGHLCTQTPHPIQMSVSTSTTLKNLFVASADTFN